MRRIVRLAEVGPQDVVLEVGPGLGSLTAGLLHEAAAVLAIEIDPTRGGPAEYHVGALLPERAGSCPSYRPMRCACGELPLA